MSCLHPCWREPPRYDDRPLVPVPEWRLRPDLTGLLLDLAFVLAIVLGGWAGVAIAAKLLDA